MADGYLVQGDTNPVLRAHLVGMDLTGASIICRVKAPGGTFDTTPTVLDAPGGIVEHDWTSQETANPGSVQVVFIVTKSGRPQTFPAAAPLLFTLKAQL